MTTISELVSDNWPVTEGVLSDRTNGVPGFVDTKIRAIARATRELYGSVTAPAEGEIPEIAKQWIADKATVRLIPVGVDFYATNRRKSDSVQNMTVTYYDRVRQLQELRDELEADCRDTLGAALNAIEAGNAPAEVDPAPVVSVDGLLVDPTSRAYLRGPY
jgi:hypothetical protein